MAVIGHHTHTKTKKNFPLEKLGAKAPHPQLPGSTVPVTIVYSTHNKGMN